LRKIPVLRLNFSHHSARDIFRLSTFFVSRLVFFANTPPKHDISVYNFQFNIKVILSKLFSYFVSFIPNYRFDNSKRPSNRRPCAVTNAIVASTPAASPRLTSSQPVSITPSVKMRRVIEPQVSEISCSDQEIRQMYV
jgi:hypothetical protein